MHSNSHGQSQSTFLAWTPAADMMSSLVAGFVLILGATSIPSADGGQSSPAAPVPPGGGLTANVPLTGDPDYFVLVHGRVYPLDGDHFTLEEGITRRTDGSMGKAVRISSPHDGESLAAGLAPGGTLAGAMVKAESGGGYILFFVAPDSVEMYRSAFRAAREHRVGSAWDTWPDQEFVVLSVGPSTKRGPIGVPGQR